jgi:Amt family ammonium transporter
VRFVAHALPHLARVRERARRFGAGSPVPPKGAHIVRRRIALVTAISGGAILVGASPAFAQDSISAETVQGQLDNTFVLLAAVLVIFMQAGFALVEAGFTRAKSVANIMMKNLMDFMVGVIAFFCVGYAVAFGSTSEITEGIHKFIGLDGFFLGAGVNDYTAAVYPNLNPLVFFVFQLAFAATAATIVSGAMAERTKFKSYFLYSIAITAFIYPVVVHWLWGGGWLAQLDTIPIDFAGSTIVHATGGIAALMGAIALGPRLGKYGPDGKPRTIQGHSIPYAVLGTFILLVGWYGFNPGSFLAADGAALGLIATNTTLAAGAGAVMAMLIAWWTTHGKADVGMAANGALAGLVGITAGCFAVSTVGALLIGAICGAVVVGSIWFLDRVKVDDPVGAVSVHGTCGILGTLLVGFFAVDDVGLFYGGNTDQLVSQLILVASVVAWVAITTSILFLVLKKTVGLRVTAQEERDGLDVIEHGYPGYGAEVFTHVEVEEVSIS